MLPLPPDIDANPTWLVQEAFEDMRWEVPLARQMVHNSHETMEKRGRDCFFDVKSLTLLLALIDFDIGSFHIILCNHSKFHLLEVPNGLNTTCHIICIHMYLVYMYILPPCCFMCPGFCFTKKKQRCHPRSWPPNPLSDSPWSRSSEALRAARDLPRRAGPYRSRPGWRPRSPFAPRKSDPPEAFAGWLYGIGLHHVAVGSDPMDGWWVEVEGKEPWQKKSTSPTQIMSTHDNIKTSREKRMFFWFFFWGGLLYGGGRNHVE